jgi:hypothetical protein
MLLERILVAFHPIVLCYVGRHTAIELCSKPGLRGGTRAFIGPGARLLEFLFTGAPRRCPAVLESGLTGAGKSRLRMRPAILVAEAPNCVKHEF